MRKLRSPEPRANGGLLTGASCCSYSHGGGEAGNDGGGTLMGLKLDELLLYTADTKALLLRGIGCERLEKKVKEADKR